MMKRRNSEGVKPQGRPSPKSSRKEPSKPDGDAIRLNKYLAHAGVASRRDADALISAGLVTVNGQTVTEMGFKVKPDAAVRYDGRLLQREKKVYVLLNKPKGFITTTHDENDRKTVMHLVRRAAPYRMYPVGRLDRPTTGVLLLTNDGDLTKKLIHPSHGIKKIYHVVLDRKLAGADLEKIKSGVLLREGLARVDAIYPVPDAPGNEWGITLHMGWNRVVRRIFEKLDYQVARLDRVSFGGLTKKGLKRGQWRILSQQEVGCLKMIK